MGDKCTRCKLHEISKCNCIPGEGPKDARIVFIGDAPGAEEEERNRPFVGEAGRLLNTMLQEVGIERDKVFITNCVRCRPRTAPPKNNRPPSSEEMEACKPYLEKELLEISPNLIVTLGGPALYTILEKNKILENAGNVTWSDKYKCNVLPVAHPAYVLHNLEYKEHWRLHFLKILELVDAKEAVKKIPTTYAVTDTFEKVETLFERLRSKEVAAVDIETSGFDYQNDKMLCVSFSWRAGVGVVVPLLGKDCVEVWSPKEKQQIVNLLKEFLEGPKLKVVQNVAFEYKFFKANGIMLRNTFDTMLAHHLLDENARHGLKELALTYTDMGTYDEELRTYLKSSKASFSIIPSEVLHKYTCADADCTFRLYTIFEKDLRKQGLMRLFKHIVMPVRHALSEVEYRGVLVDRVYLEELHEKYTEQLKGLEKKFKEDDAVKQACSILLEKEKEKIKQAYLKLKSPTISIEEYIEKHLKPIEFNMGSTLQLRVLFFDVLKASSIKKSSTTQQESTDGEVLDILKKKYVQARLLLKFRELTKLDNTYVKGLLKRLDKDSRLHTSYLVHGTETGRLSSVDPNLQNVPKENKDIKRAFIADPGYALIEADFCFTGDTKVYVIGNKVCGPMSLRMIVRKIQKGEALYTYTYSTKKEEVEINQIVGGWKTKDDAELLEITLDNGKKVKCTLGHRFMLRDGTYIEARKLEEGTSLMPFYTNEEAEYWSGYKKPPIKYRRIYLNNGSWDFEHCLINEYIFKQRQPGMLVHHKNSNGTCNHLDNLEPMTRAMHFSHHSKQGHVRVSLKERRQNQNKQDREAQYRKSSATLKATWARRTPFEREMISKKIKEGLAKLGTVEGSSNHNWQGGRSERFKCKVCGKVLSYHASRCKRCHLDSIRVKRVLPYCVFCNKQLSTELHRVVEVQNLKCHPCAMKLRRKKKKEEQNLQNHVVVKVCKLKTRDSVYNIEVADNHNFALAAGVFVSNCQAEFRLWASYSQDPQMLEDIKSGIDIHTLTASRVYNIPINQVTDRQRGQAKGCVFGLMYGRGVRSLAEEFGLSIQKAQETVDTFFGRYPRARRWLDDTRLFAIKNKYVQNIFGRIRRLPAIDSKDEKVKNHALNNAVNSPIQGGIGDINSIATIRIADRIKKEQADAFILLTVHDCLVFEVKEEILEKFILLIKEEMERPIDGVVVPMQIEMKIGKNWADMQETLV